MKSFAVLLLLAQAALGSDGLEYQGSDKVFAEKKAQTDNSEDAQFDPEKAKQNAYEDYIRQYAEQTQTGDSIWANKQDQGIYWNLDVPDLEAHMQQTDTLKFLYVYDSKTSIERDQQDWRVLDLMFVQTIQELEGGYVTAFAYDCQWKDARQLDFDSLKKRFGCDKRPFQPAFTVWKTPDIRVNPYTGKKMPLEVSGFGSTEITQPRIKDWFINNQPDFTQELITEEDVEQFDAEEGISKVFLFSTKKATPPIYQALAANLNNQLRFAIIKKQHPIAEGLAAEFGVEKWPTLLVKRQIGT